MENPPIRQTAYIVKISDLLKGNFIKEDNWNPNYVTIGSKKVSRVSIIGVVINVKDDNNYQNIMVDDGSGEISVRNFEKKSNINIGEVVLLVGRVREFGNERYLTPEIIKKSINPKWSKIWKEHAIKNNKTVTKEDEEEKPEEPEEKSANRAEKVLERIKDLDDGTGALFKDVVKNTDDEKIISNLLLQGDVFEIKPGKLKVLD